MDAGDVFGFDECGGLANFAEGLSNHLTKGGLRIALISVVI
jgi:hypothetical protein